MRHKDVPEGNADALPGTAIPQPMQISFLEKKNVVSFSLPLPAVKHVFYSVFFLSIWLCLCVLVSGLARKKVGETFGVYVKRLYLCTRFREARPCVAAADRGR